VRSARVLTRSFARARLISLMNSTPLKWITPDLFRPSRVDYPSVGQLYPGSRGKKKLYLHREQHVRSLPNLLPAASSPIIPATLRWRNSYERTKYVERISFMVMILLTTLRYNAKRCAKPLNYIWNTRLLFSLKCFKIAIIRITLFMKSR